MQINSSEDRHASHGHSCVHICASEAHQGFSSCRALDVCCFEPRKIDPRKLGSQRLEQSHPAIDVKAPQSQAVQLDEDEEVLAQESLADVSRLLLILLGPSR